MSRRLAFGLVALALGCAAPATAQEGPNPRVRPEQVDGTAFNVVVPQDYERSGERYPVLYLLHPSIGYDRDSWVIRSDLLRYTQDRETIVVLLDAGDSGIVADGRDGSCRRETQLMRGVIPYVDAHYRTIPGRAHRAIAGASGGGFSALHLAARNPDEFVAVAGLSAPADVTLGLSPAGQTLFVEAERAAVAECGGNPADPTNGLFGNPLRDELWVHNANPPDLAPNFRGTSVYLAAGTGQPCDPEDLPEAYVGAASVVLTRPGSVSFARALDRAGVPYRGDLDGCGIHSFRYFEAYLHDFWPEMTAAFGAAPPRSFDYRRADPRFSVWGWSFEADPRRAPEFLHIRGASRGGLRITGSGTASITTAAYWQPGRRVRVSHGRTASVVRAGADGRLRFTADLGPPHEIQQYRQENAGAEGAPGYFKTREVTFRPVPARVARRRGRPGGGR